ncbi:MAG: hypothetical protein KAS32_16220 [Candidatus Peribacteraceae bacterium]|nr:hypothetical protein [Candidatus Peribacteraceae bacterium]
MKKVILITMLVLAMATTVSAARIKCTIFEIKTIEDSDDTAFVVMKCEKYDKLVIGDKVKVSLPKKKTAIEGC